MSIFFLAIGSIIVSDSVPVVRSLVQLVAAILLLSAVFVGWLIAKRDPRIFVEASDERSSRRSSAHPAIGVGVVMGFLLMGIFAAGHGGVNAGIGTAMMILGSFVAYGTTRVLVSVHASKG